MKFRRVGVPGYYDSRGTYDRRVDAREVLLLSNPSLKLALHLSIPVLLFVNAFFCLRIDPCLVHQFAKEHPICIKNISRWDTTS